MHSRRSALPLGRLGVWGCTWGDETVVPPVLCHAGSRASFPSYFLPGYKGKSHGLGRRNDNSAAATCVAGMRIVWPGWRHKILGLGSLPHACRVTAR